MLKEIIETLSKEEIRYYKLSMQRYNVVTPRLDSQLFDAFKSASKSELDETELSYKLYGTEDKNNYYKLKFRVTEDILDNLSQFYVSKNKLYRIHQYFTLFNIFFEKNRYNICLQLILRCEKIALAIEQFELLDHIYSEFIRLSIHHFDINPEDYIKKRTLNLTRLNDLIAIDQVIAIVHYKMVKTVNYTKSEKNIESLLAKTIEKYSHKKNLQNSKVFQVRIFKAVSQQLIQKKEYQSLLDYCITVRKRFVAKKWFDATTHETQVLLQIYFCNCLFLLKKHNEVTVQAAILLVLLGLHNKQLYNKYIPFYYNVVVGNYTALKQPTQALAKIDEMEAELKKLKIAYYIQFVTMNRALCQYELLKYQAALKSIFRFYISDEYNKVAESYRFKIALAELMIMLENKDFEGVKLRHEQVRKEFKKWLSNQKDVLDFEVFNYLLLFTKIDSKKYVTSVIDTTIALVTKIKKSNVQENFIINFENWWNKNKIIHKQLNK